jgi:hypothetical protein
MAIRDIVPADIKEQLFNKIDEYQNGGNLPSGAKKLKKPQEVIDVDYIDDDYAEDL